MKKQLDIKKLLILNLPYLLMGLFATNFGEAWRMAQGADASAKMLSFFSTLPVALASWWPSLHPLDLLVGLCCGAGLRLAVYLKSKNAKKYRHGMEYGSARWGFTGASRLLCLFSFFSLRWARYLQMAALNSRPVNFVPLTTSVKVLFSTSSCIGHRLLSTDFAGRIPVQDDS